MSVSNTWQDNFSISDTDLSFGHNAEAGIIIADSLQIRAIYERTYGVINGTDTQRKSAIITVMPKLTERFGVHLNGGVTSTQINNERGRQIFNQQNAGVSIGLSFNELFGA